MSILSRIWAGVVAATAGVAVGTVIHLAGMMAVGLPLDYLQWIAIGSAALGFVIGFAVGNRDLTRGPKNTQ